jgi:hypothetical protein
MRLQFTILTLLDDEYKVEIFSWFHFPKPMSSSSIFGPNILLSTLFSKNRKSMLFLQNAWLNSCMSFLYFNAVYMFRPLHPPLFNYPNIYYTSTTNNEAHKFSIFCNLLLPSTSVLGPTLCSQIPWICVLSLQLKWSLDLRPQNKALLSNCNLFSNRRKVQIGPGMMW